MGREGLALPAFVRRGLFWVKASSPWYRGAGGTEPRPLAGRTRPHLFLQPQPSPLRRLLPAVLQKLTPYRASGHFPCLGFHVSDTAYPSALGELQPLPGAAPDALSRNFMNLSHPWSLMPRPSRSKVACARTSPTRLRVLAATTRVYGPPQSLAPINEFFKGRMGPGLKG